MTEAVHTPTTPPDAALLTLGSARRRAWRLYDALGAADQANPVVTATEDAAFDRILALRAQVMTAPASTLAGAALQAAYCWQVADNLYGSVPDAEDVAHAAVQLRAGLASVLAVLLTAAGAGALTATDAGLLALPRPAAEALS